MFKKLTLLLTFFILFACSATSFAVGEKGTILFEYFYDIGGGTTIPDLTGHATYPDGADEALFMTSFDGLLDTADSYDRGKSADRIIHLCSRTWYWRNALRTLPEMAGCQSACICRDIYTVHRMV